MQSADGGAPLVYFTRKPDLPGLELVRYPQLSRGWRGIPDAYAWFTMIPWLEGDVEVISRGVHAQCVPGSVTVGEPGEPYVLRPHSEMRGEFRVIRVDYARLEEITREAVAHGVHSPFPRSPVVSGRHAAMFYDAYQAIEHGDKLNVDESLAVFVTAMIGLDIDATMARTADNRRPVACARELLHARFDTAVSLEELAQAASMDRFALLRAFSRELGLTPHAYQVQLRVARASRLIAEHVPLADVALAVGYSEQSALQRTFKQLVGVTPGAYARAHQ
jgi:AraC-like DNA-binding protein